MNINITEFNFYKKLTHLPFVEAIILYGSRARGNFQKKSDIDLAIVCPEASDEEWFTISDIIDEADTLLKIDCVRFDKLSDDDSFKKEIIKDGKYLYKKEK
jgi:predicted nucleotidyltransferase